MSRTVLHINSSARLEDSVTRQIGEQVIKHLQQQHDGLLIHNRDLAAGENFISADWVHANFTAEEERTTQQVNTLQHSTALVAQIEQADYLLIEAPMYNFSIPAVLKAWIDQIARAKLTFKYTAAGPVGLMRNKKAILVMASGGVAIGSELDFATPYLQQVMRFIGINDITVIDANGLNQLDDLQTLQLFATDIPPADTTQEHNHHA